MLVNQIIKRLKDSGVKEFVVESGLCGAFEELNEVNKTCIADVRSATFYACGVAQRLDAPVTLLVRKEYLANVYTALMEAWFQRRKVIVLAFGENILNYSLECYKTCTSIRTKVQNIDDFDTGFANTPSDLPTIFLVEEKVDYNTIKNGASVEEIVNAVPQEYRIFAYASALREVKDLDRVKYVFEEDKYGMIAKFLGNCIAKKERGILLTHSSILKLEMNIFNSRYIDQRFNLIVVGEKPDKNLAQWIKSNGIAVEFCPNVEQASAKILDSTSATVVFVAEEE